MIDRAKRQTFKIIAVSTGTLLTTPAVLASNLFGANTNRTNTNRAGYVKPVGQIEVESRLSAQTGELEIVLTNIGDNNAVITQITPASIQHAQGDFNLQSVIANGPLQLKAGESVPVVLAHNSDNKNKALHHSAASLSHVLTNNVSVVTENQAFV